MRVRWNEQLGGFLRRFIFFLFAYHIPPFLISCFGTVFLFLHVATFFSVAGFPGYRRGSLLMCQFVIANQVCSATFLNRQFNCEGIIEMQVNL